MENIVRKAQRHPNVTSNERRPREWTGAYCVFVVKTGVRSSMFHAAEKRMTDPGPIRRAVEEWLSSRAS